MNPGFSFFYIFFQAAKWKELCYETFHKPTLHYNVIERLKIENENRECFTEKTVEVGIENQYL